jgi:chemotaxis protein histidine kinase CheA/ActR/RegA family two-component response regulator
LIAPLPPFDFEEVGGSNPVTGDLAAELLASYPATPDQRDEGQATGEESADDEVGTYDLSGSDLAEMTGDHSSAAGELEIPGVSGDFAATDGSGDSAIEGSSDTDAARAEAAAGHIATDYMAAHASAANEEVSRVQTWTPESTQAVPTLDGSSHEGYASEAAPLLEDQPYAAPVGEEQSAPWDQHAPASPPGQWAADTSEPPASAGQSAPWEHTASPDHEAGTAVTAGVADLGATGQPPASEQFAAPGQWAASAAPGPWGADQSSSAAETPFSGQLPGSADQWGNTPPPAAYESPASGNTEQWAATPPAAYEPPASGTTGQWAAPPPAAYEPPASGTTGQWAAAPSPAANEPSAPAANEPPSSPTYAPPPVAPYESPAPTAAASPPAAPPAAEQPAAAVSSKSVSFSLGRTEPKSSDEVLLPPQAVPPGREPVAPAERQEMARVDADLLDQLLNISGEASIARSRLEQQLGSIDFNLGELSRTVTRLKEQLRNLEIETEAQILHRHEDESSHRGDFDPLELDRYSSIQQFSRALAETANDVGSIQQLLENLGKETQNLLQQQARTITELQNGLMRTRMVPFQRHVQRLSRIVRQAANDTGKKAELVVEGASGELDRQVLERMLPPFEHMLRNAVVHGIEKPRDRVAAGKPEAGRIVLELHREGAEVMVRLIDDGGGMNLKAIRDKGAALGLIPPGQTLSDEDAMQLILEPGFSTAGTITQQAGRGVGMDVVATEIKRLGGALHMETKPGQGTVFTIRLPFTLAISHALVVRTGDEFYALPLPTVEGVLRLSKAEVLAHLGKDASAFDYGGQKYRFQHLAAFVALEPSPLPEQDVTIPVVLVRAGEHSTGLVADELVGSREIVVKSVGPQISSIRGISGATILGDGRIVIILDIGALVRAEWRGRAQPPVVSKDKSDKRTFAMVVDDSITVRRVTQRLLERNGMRVLTARDGMDAVTLLQDNIPDVILLDIEMPRMDGYEVAAYVRNDPRLKDVPIIMITSRVGEKHRARAIELGVDDYLGKPYQEAQLLDAIAPLVERRRATMGSGSYERVSDARV